MRLRASSPSCSPSSTATAAGAFATQIARSTVRQAARLQRSTDQLSRYFSPDIAAGIRDGSAAFLQAGGREQEQWR